MAPVKQYLGDGVYVERAGPNLILTTSDGWRDTNRIILDPIVVCALQDFIESLQPTSRGKL